MVSYNTSFTIYNCFNIKLDFFFFKEEEIERLMTMKKYPTIPKECTVESMSYVEKMIYQFKKSFASDPCKDYYV